MRDPVRKITGAMLLIVALLGFAGVGLVVYSVLSSSDNHVGWNVLNLAAVFSVMILLAALRWLQSIGSNKINAALLVFGIVSVLLIVAVYHFNILLPYEVWIERGMPDRPF